MMGPTTVLGDAHRMGDRVLVVDDDPDVLDTLATALEDAGYQVLRAVDGVAGIVKAQAHHPDLILLDIMMPGRYDGYAVCTQLRSGLETRDIPIIFVSATADTRVRVKSLQVGGDDFMAKPFDLTELLARVVLALRHRSPRPAALVVEDLS